MPRLGRTRGVALCALGVALLIPLIIVAGILAVFGAITVRTCRRKWTRRHRPHQGAVPAVVHLDATAANATLGGAP